MGLFNSQDNAAAVAMPGKDLSLLEAYKHLSSQVGRTDANTLTNQLATTILEHSIREGASDVHFDPQGDMIVVRFRIDGELKDRLSFARKQLPVTSQLRVMAGFSPQAATAYSPEDGAFSILVDNRNVRFRASSFPTIHGDKLVIRLLDMGVNTLNLDLLGFMPQDLQKLKQTVASSSGIFFVCGITGGGKTTTLCSILKYLNKPELNIMTLEDPVEYELPRTTQSSINAKAGFGFADGLRSILRQDPNIIMVGEIRDQETAEIAMRAALTGHLIFSTLHTISTTGVITRLADIGVEPFLISDAMIGALAQRLAKKICSSCAAPAQPDPMLVDELVRKLTPEDSQAIMKMIMTPGGKFSKGKGCPDCKNTGYKGRVGLFELLTLTKPLRDLIANKSPIAEVRRAAVSLGMKTLMMDGVAKAWYGQTTLEEVKRVTGEI